MSEPSSKPAKKQIRLGAFLQAVGHHLAAWRDPEVQPRDLTDFVHYRRLTAIAEDAKFDAVFFADNVGLPGASPEVLSRGALTYYYEPLTLLAALAPLTSRIGLIATVSASYMPPYHVARKFASLDHLSEGRVGWNVVTSGTDFEAQNFGLDHQRTHKDRYARAAEHVEVVKGLWDSWDDGAILDDPARDRFFDPTKVRALNHKGAHFSVAGPLQSGRPVQGHPVIVQAGSSDDGQDLAAATGEVVFTAQQTRAGAQAFYRGLKDRAVALGRSADSVLIMPGLMPFVAPTKAEAEDRFAALQALVDPAMGMGLLSGLIGWNLSGFPLDGPVPDPPATEGWQSRQKLFVDIARAEGLTIRQLMARVVSARGHRVIVGDAITVADEMQEWFEGGAADGFNILPPTLPHGLDAFARLVVPELQKRGLFRTAYEGKTLRDHLGLARPVRV